VQIHHTKKGHHCHASANWGARTDFYVIFWGQENKNSKFLILSSFKTLSNNSISNKWLFMHKHCEKN
jgi:hypothetical protein